MATPSLRNRFYCLEACRGLAALVIVFRHACVHAFEGPIRIAFIPAPSATAVTFFFVLSGVVMGLAHPGGKASFRTALTFLFRRILRIYPLYWIVLLLTVSLWPFLRQSLSLNYVLLIPHAMPDRSVFMQDLIPAAWTLHWEILFYVAFAITMAIARGSMLLVVWFLMIVMFNTVFQPPANSTLLIFTDPMAVYFLAGSLVAATIKWIDTRRAVACLLIGGALTAYSVIQGDFGLYLPIGMLRVSIAATGMGLVLAALIALETNKRLPIGNWCLRLGQISYPIYLSHWLFMELAYREFWRRGFNVHQHDLIYFIALVVAGLVGGIATTYLVDLPMQRFIKRLFFSRQSTA